MLGPTYLTTCHLLTLRRQQMWKTEESIMPSCPEQFSIIYAFKIKHVKGNPTLLGMIISLITVDQTGEGRTRTRTVLASARAQEKTIAKTKLNAKRTKKIAFSSESKAIWTNPQGLGGGTHSLRVKARYWYHIQPQNTNSMLLKDTWYLDFTLLTLTPFQRLPVKKRHPV